MNPFLKFDIKDLLEQGVGNRETYSFNAPINYEDIEHRSNVEGMIEIMRLHEGFNVKLYDIKVDVEFECVRSLDKFTHTITIEEANKIFYLEMPKEIYDPNDLFLVDKKKKQIDITEFLRQEIILHFPSIPVNYRGINELLDKYSKENLPENKPLAGLKDLLK